jgi:uncharacterized protein with HEPN domain
MSSRDLRVYFEDMLRSMDRIDTFIGTMTFEQYTKDLKTASAVERQFLILSEAATRLGTDIVALCPGPEWRDIRGIGNVIRHRYQDVMDETLWHTISDLFPALRSAIHEALANQALWDHLDEKK